MNALPRRLRAKWDELIATEGAAMGLSECRVFLENKLVNDIFYVGLHNGRPCMVKCSSRAPESIVNEYEIGRRLHAVAPAHFPAVYACRPGRFAFVVTERIGESISLADRPCDGYADEIAAILDALYAANVVYRDVLPSNFLISPDGHLKLIDFQFAVDMSSGRVDPWLMKHPTYHFAVFAAGISDGGAWWDDAAFACTVFPSARPVLRSRIGRLRFEMRFSFPVRMLLAFHVCKMRVQRMFCGRKSRKYRTLTRRLERFG